ncbi:hypothetical protein SGO_0257 [Streptococcus gordonii str. Challis substr. CH1]|uniref:Uncharacterized protein n=1 Tax=Streptococcus gordonii (strain Challis / ATCC 35105 / BCRC 15272 / CH1 / DL1 / V288) TaxID=467705 RepID=A8AUW6_STRGC|nr:hypothetical protein SGO_0257 [Streptococcus gordonii str. Challis substr. CH1]
MSHAFYFNIKKSKVEKKIDGLFIFKHILEKQDRGVALT